MKRLSNSHYSPSVLTLQNYKCLEINPVFAKEKGEKNRFVLIVRPILVRAAKISVNILPVIVFLLYFKC